MERGRRQTNMQRTEMRHKIRTSIMTDIRSRQRGDKSETEDGDEVMRRRKKK
jgi:hypothetical protein